MEDEFYSESFFDGLVINYFTYSGRGRPRNTDYIPFDEAQRLLNKAMNDYLDQVKIRIIEYEDGTIESKIYE